MHHISLHDNLYENTLVQNELLDEKSYGNISALNSHPLNNIPFNDISEVYFLESQKYLPLENFSKEELFPKVEKEDLDSNLDENKKSDSNNKSTSFSSPKRLLFNIYKDCKDERRKKKKKKIEESLEKKENNNINKKRERENKNKKKRGIQRQTKKKKEHTGTDFDNMLVKIQNHYLSFLINFSNDVSATVLGDEYKDSFKNIAHASKINIKYRYFNEIKSKQIQDFLKLDISKKYTNYKKDSNRESLDALCKKSKWLKNNYFEMNFLDLFNYYYNHGNILETVNIEGINVTLSDKTKTFYHLKDNNKDQEVYLLNVLKSVYFNGYDELIPKLAFTTLKNGINND